MSTTNETHAPSAKSWIDSANTESCDFPLQNLPFGIFSTTATDKRVGVAIGDQILDLNILEKSGLLRPADNQTVFGTDELNSFMSLGPKVWNATRKTIFDLLHAGSGRLRDDHELQKLALVPTSTATMHLPVFVRSFTDFYASKEHASNVGTMFRGPEKALPPNWMHIPIGYNGRASSVVVSGTPIHRPWGQLKGIQDALPRFAPSQQFDIELEFGAIVGTPNRLGQPVTTAEAQDMIFGYVILNDWSARDIQAWEYQPLGPFQSKATATTISPWVVTREALEPFRVKRPDSERPLLPYLREETPNSFDIDMTISLTPPDGEPSIISRTNYKYIYYTFAQQLTHHASSGCAMCTGDLLGSGTISGPDKKSLGSLLEMSWGGKDPITLNGGETRTFVDDGDTLEFTAHCRGDGYRLGFGSCSGQVLPAVQFPGIE